MYSVRYTLNTIPRRGRTQILYHTQTDIGNPQEGPNEYGKPCTPDPLTVYIISEPRMNNTGAVCVCGGGVLWGTKCHKESKYETTKTENIMKYGVNVGLYGGVCRSVIITDRDFQLIFREKGLPLITYAPRERGVMSPLHFHCVLHAKREGWGLESM